MLSSKIATFFKGTGPGHLPQDWPGLGPALMLGFQHFLAIFPATVLVPVLTGFNVSATLFASGVATLAALVVTKFKVPLYYGSSFSAIAAVGTVVKANGGGDVGVSVAAVGILAAGIVQVLVGLLVVKRGPESVDKVLPPIVQGSVAFIISAALYTAAINMASGMCCLRDASDQPYASLTWWTAAIITFLAVVFWTWRLRSGLLGMLPILGGGFIGYLLSIPLGLVNLSALATAEAVRPPHLIFPAFSHPGAVAAVLSIAVVPIATIPESLAHFTQVRLTIEGIGAKVRRKAEDIRGLIGRNLVGDGVGDLITGFFGGAMGTNYGETIATIIASGAATVFAVVIAANMAILSSLSGHLEALVKTIPTPVTGGLSIYMFVAFGIVGLNMLQKAGNLLSAKNLAVLAWTFAMGIAGGNSYSGSLPIPLSEPFAALLPGGVPAIAAGAFGAIVINFVGERWAPKEQEEVVAVPAIAVASQPE